MAEFVKVAQEWARMCEMHKNCMTCPIERRVPGTIGCYNKVKEAPEKCEEAIMAWAKAFPRKTMEDVLFERLPGIKQGDDGSYVICPRHINPEWAKGEWCDEHNAEKVIMLGLFRARSPERCRKCWRRFVE